MTPYSLNSFLEVNNNRITGLENPVNDQDAVNKRYLVNNYIANSEIGVSVAPLVSGLVPLEYLPSYVDEILEYATLSVFPVTGTANKIYLDLDTNLIYRWSGSTYIQISQGTSIPSLISYFTNDVNYITLTDVTWANIPDKPSLNFVPTSDIGVTVAPLVTGLIPGMYLPSYVDDVLEYANLAALPVTGEAGKIYVTLDTNKTYRWSGTIYIEISASAAQVNTDWNATSGVQEILNKPTLADFVRRDGSTPLTANWNVGAFDINSTGALNSTTLTTTGATTVGGALGVTGTTATNGITNTGNIANWGNMTNTGLLTTAGANITGALNVYGAASFGTTIQTLGNITAGSRLIFNNTSGTNFIDRIYYPVRTLAALNLISLTEGENVLVTERGIRNAIDGIQFTSAQVENGLSAVAGKFRLGGTLLTGNTDLLNVAGSAIRIRNIANTGNNYSFGQATFNVGDPGIGLIVNSTFSGTLTVNTGITSQANINAIGNLNILGNSSLGGTLAVSGTSNFSSAITTTGGILAGSQRIQNVLNPTAAQDAATKSYVDARVLPTMTDAQIIVSNIAVPTARTLSGDLSITNLGVASVITAAITNNKLAQMAANTVKVNNTSSSAVATDISLTANTLLARGSGDISAIAYTTFVERISGTTGNRSTAIPSPLIGQFYANSTTSRPEWYDGSTWKSIPLAQILLTEIQNIANNRFLGNLTGSATFPQEIPGLDIWDSAQQSFRYNIGGINEWLSGSIFNQVNSVTVANTVAETNLIGTGQTGSTSTLPASFFVAGKSLSPKMWGIIGTNATAPTIRIQVKLGSTVLLDSGVTAMNAITATQLFNIDLFLTCRTTGVSGTVIQQGVFRYFRDSTSEERIGLVSTAAVTVDTTIAQTLTITIIWGTANASNTITSTNFKLLKEG